MKGPDAGSVPRASGAVHENTVHEHTVHEHTVRENTVHESDGPRPGAIMAAQGVGNRGSYCRG